MSLVNRTKTALDESRMLMLGSEILLGFQFEAPFQTAFDDLTATEKSIELAVLCILIVVIGLLIAPSARHRLVERGEATESINRFITRMSLVVLLPFALALALDIGIAGARIAGPPLGVSAGLLAAMLALGFWYGPYLARNGKAEDMPTSDEKTPTAAKIDYALTEARVVLPGAQALLGFQLTIVLTTGFAELPYAAKLVHGGALALIGVGIILLMAPAAHHRIVYGGGDALEFYVVASRYLLAATVFLACGLAADMHMVVGKITDSPAAANLGAGATLILLLGLWHAWPWWRRTMRQRPRPRPQP
jgi:hypothetical protein